MHPAKLNLHLEVVKKREDGFHDIRTVFQLINLCDEMEFKVNKTEINLEETPEIIKNNLVLKAAHFLREKTNTAKGITISLSKKIPIEKGLGGGSSDAAATLIALNKLWETRLKTNQLMQIGLELGSDVPFFIHGRSAWAEGRGELITELHLPKMWYLLAFPKTRISTKEAFEDIRIPEASLINKEDFLFIKYNSDSEGPDKLSVWLTSPTSFISNISVFSIFKTPTLVFNLINVSVSDSLIPLNVSPPFKLIAYSF